MKNATKWLLGVAVALPLLTSCGSKKTIVTFTPEESGLNMVKITDESKNAVLAGSQYRSPFKFNFANSTLAGSTKQKFTWSTIRTLDVSPDGKRLAYMTSINDRSNVMVRSTGSQGAATQRTFRNVVDFSWGKDGKFYFADANGEYTYICSVGDGQGNMIGQITNGSVVDRNPVSLDGQRIFFTRTNPKYGPSVWMLNREGTVCHKLIHRRNCGGSIARCTIPMATWPSTSWPTIPYQDDGIASGSSTLTVGVQAGQSTAENVSQSDLLTDTIDVYSSTSAVELSFSRRMAKIKVELARGLLDGVRPTGRQFHPHGQWLLYRGRLRPERSHTHHVGHGQHQGLHTDGDVAEYIPSLHDEYDYIK